MNILELPNVKNIKKAKDTSDRDVFRYVFDDGTVGTAYFSRVNNGDEMGLKSNAVDMSKCMWVYCLNSGNICEMEKEQDVEVMEHELRIVGVDNSGCRYREEGRSIEIY